MQTIIDCIISTPPYSDDDDIMAATKVQKKKQKWQKWQNGYSTWLARMFAANAVCAHHRQYLLYRTAPNKCGKRNAENTQMYVCWLVNARDL